MPLTLSSDLFACQQRSRHLVVEASMLPLPIGRIPLAFVVVSSKTQTSLPFKRSAVLKDQEGEVYGWRYEVDRDAVANRSDLWDITATIFND
jgi:hypothetical protein